MSCDPQPPDYQPRPPRLAMTPVSNKGIIRVGPRTPVAQVSTSPTWPVGVSSRTMPTQGLG